jgi:hypothetical protein
MTEQCTELAMLKCRTVISEYLKISIVLWSGLLASVTKIYHYICTFDLFRTIIIPVRRLTTNDQIRAKFIVPFRMKFRINNCRLVHYATYLKHSLLNTYVVINAHFSECEAVLDI